jgi:ATP-dependent exoDNAse (exonuclease V) beta subunit
MTEKILMNPTEMEKLIEGARPEQKLAIRSTAPLTVLSAGAGTGKTQTLASRFAWLLASDPDCRADQILTLTFTNAAAAEMRERIRATLVSWLAAGVSHLKDAVARLDEAYISTIHSFALRVIRETGEAGFRTSLVTAAAESEFWEDFVWRLKTRTADEIAENLPDEWRVFARGVLSDENLYLLNFYGAETVAELGRAACDTFGSMNRTPEEIRDALPEWDAAAIKKITARLAPLWSETWDVWRGMLFPALSASLEKKTGGVFHAALRDFIEKWAYAERNQTNEAMFFAGLAEDALKNLSGGKELKEIIAGAVPDLTAWRNASRPAAALSRSISSAPPYSEEERRACSFLAGASALAWKCWEVFKQRRDFVSFSDFARIARPILANDKTYAARFRHVMIDEFQDTDELQNSLITSLAASWDKQSRRTLFIVGDIKQSIYGFRHANPRLFARYMTEGENISMPRSFRMNGALMECLNIVFGDVWERGVISDGSFSVGYEPLVPPAGAAWQAARDERSGSLRSPDCPAEIILFSPESDGGEKVSAPEARKQLARLAAARLKALVENETPVWRKDERRFTKMEWRDAALLVLSKSSSYGAIEDAFAEAGIPVSLEKGRDYFNRGEVRDFVSLLRALGDPEDAVAIAGWMESPFSGAAPLEGVKFLNAARRGEDIAEALRAANPECAARLAELRREARLRRPSEVLFALIEDVSWARAYPAAARERAVANVRRGAEILREYETSRGISLPACASYLEHAVRGGTAAEEPDAPGGRDAVRVMTVHASKGLEFPVVFLMNVESSEKKSAAQSRASVSPELGPVVSSLPDGSETVRKRWRGFLEREREAEESERLMYVAMTRARDRLVCCGTLREKNAAGNDWLSKILRANEKNGDPIPVTVSGPLPETARPRTAPPKETAPAAISRRAVPAPRAAAMSATAYSLLAWCPAAYRLRYRQGMELKWARPGGADEEANGGAESGGAEIGSLAHWVLSRWDYDAASVSSFIPGAIGADEAKREIAAVPPRLTAVWKDEKNRRDVREWMSAFAKTETAAELREALANGTLKREMSFSVRLGDLTLAGSMDLFWEDENGARVRDWKTAPEGGAPSEMYSAQLDFYALACHAVRPEARVDAGLIYLRGSGGVSIRPVENWDELERRVAEAAEISAGRFEKKDGARCESCPFKINDICSAKKR